MRWTAARLGSCALTPPLDSRRPRQVCGMAEPRSRDACVRPPLDSVCSQPARAPATDMRDSPPRLRASNGTTYAQPPRGAPSHHSHSLQRSAAPELERAREGSQISRGTYSHAYPTIPCHRADPAQSRGGPRWSSLVLAPCRSCRGVPQALGSRPGTRQGMFRATPTRSGARDLGADWCPSRTVCNGRALSALPQTLRASYGTRGPLGLKGWALRRLRLNAFKRACFKAAWAADSLNGLKPLSTRCGSRGRWCTRCIRCSPSSCTCHPRPASCPRRMTCTPLGATAVAPARLSRKSRRASTR